MWPLNTIKGHCNKVYEDATVPGSLNPQKGTVSNHTGHNTARVKAGYSPLLLLSSVTHNVELHLLCLDTVSSEMCLLTSESPQTFEDCILVHSYNSCGVSSLSQSEGTTPVDTVHLPKVLSRLPLRRPLRHPWNSLAEAAGITISAVWLWSHRGWDCASGFCR